MPGGIYSSYAPRHACWVHDQVREHGRRPAMWTDQLLRAPQMAAELGSDVLMVDWHYTTPLWESSLELFARSPFEFWGAPATICWMSCVSPNPVNIGNLREFSARAPLSQSWVDRHA